MRGWQPSCYNSHVGFIGFFAMALRIFRFRWVCLTLAALLVCLISSVLLPAFATEKTLSPTPVPAVNLPKYQGTWYEVAAIPMFFQRKCAKNTQATYTLRDSGKLDVLNQCTKANGDVVSARGRAWVPNTTAPSQLKVTFANLFGWWLTWFNGDYWIIDLTRDSADGYNTVIIGHPKYTYGWLLARQPNLSDETLLQLSQTLRRQGYNPCDFMMTTQDTGRPQLEANLPLCEVVH